MYNKITAPTASDVTKQSELFIYYLNTYFKAITFIIHEYAARQNTNVRIIFLQYILLFHLFGHSKIFFTILHNPKFLLPGKVSFDPGRASHYQ